MKSLFLLPAVLVLSAPVLTLADESGTSPTAQEIVTRMAARDVERENSVDGYAGRRRYVLENHQFHKRAEMLVEVRGEPQTWPRGLGMIGRFLAQLRRDRGIRLQVGNTPSLDFVAYSVSHIRSPDFRIAVGRIFLLLAACFYGLIHSRLNLCPHMKSVP
jgi:hypothetical protein